jgi:hypothetical protein
MSCRLLMSITPLPHILADDLESFLHVLSWVALRFTSHCLDSDQLSVLMSTMFDHSFGVTGLTRGGSLKQDGLLSGKVPRSRFKNTAMQALLEKLTSAVAARYEEPPSEKQLAMMQMFQEKQLDPLKCDSYAAHYQLKMRNLESSDWMLKTFREALADRQAWPSDDRSENELVMRPPSHKRKPELSEEYLARKRLPRPISEGKGSSTMGCEIVAKRPSRIATKKGRRK